MSTLRKFPKGLSELPGSSSVPGDIPSSDKKESWPIVLRAPGDEKANLSHVWSQLLSIHEAHGFIQETLAGHF